MHLLGCTTEQQREQLLTRFQDVFTSWAQRWSFDKPNCQWRVVVEDQAPSPQPEQTVAFSGEFQQLIVGASELTLPDDAVLEAILEKSGKELTDAFNAIADVNSGNATRSARWLKFSGETAFGDFSVQAPEPCFIEMPLADSDKTLASLPQAQIQHLLGQLKVPVSVELALGNVSVESINGLAVGDVLVSNTSLEQSLNLTANNQHLATADLGKSNTHKAIILKELNAND